MTKRTPLESFQALRRIELANRQAEQAARDAVLERGVTDGENKVRIFADHTLSPNQRLEIFEGLQDWPRFVLGLYNAELAIAQAQKQKSGAQKYGNEKPSDTAYRVIGEALGLGPDRIHDLCTEGRKHQKQGMPPRPEMRVAEFVSLHDLPPPGAAKARRDKSRKKHGSRKKR